MGTLHMEFLSRQMLKAACASDYSLTLLTIVGRGVATLLNLLRKLIDLTFILHIELDRCVIIEK